MDYFIGYFNFIRCVWIIYSMCLIRSLSACSISSTVLMWLFAFFLGASQWEQNMNKSLIEFVICYAGIIEFCSVREFHKN